MKCWLKIDRLTIMMVVQCACITSYCSATIQSKISPDLYSSELDHQNETIVSGSNIGESASNQIELESPISSIQDEQVQLEAGTENAKDLPKVSASMNADDAAFIQASEIAYNNDLEQFNSYSVGEGILMGLMTIIHSTAYHTLFTHRYDNYEDIKRSSGPSENSELCLAQLESMHAREARLEQDGLESTDANIYQILNTWGRASSGMILGDAFFVGSYEECLRSKLETDGEPKGADMRYCITSLKFENWPQLDRHDLLGIKAAVCIPKACDSSDYKNKYQLISEIVSRQLGPSKMDRLKMTSLYCLPDRNSPLRRIRHSPKARIVLACFGLWVALLIYATYKYNKIEKRMRLRQANQGSDEQPDELELNVKIFKMLSITNNIKRLFNTTEKSTLLESSSSSGATNAKPAPNEQANSGASQDPSVDLSCIEGIKVIAMCYIIMGHMCMCVTIVMTNGRDMAKNGTGPFIFFLANMVPAFAVNSFFTITGLLTCYLLFKQNEAHQIITSPVKWVALIVNRYLRIMPMYALVVLYCKTLAKYTSSGPLWDYGTSALSQRQTCEQESWLWTLTFTSNLLSPMQHCIPGGWYLSNDFQFMLVTPIFLVTLYLRPRLGKALIYSGIVAGCLVSFVSIYSSQVTDLKSIAMFLPFAFKTYVSHLSFNYTHPQYRIPAYLIGLLIGYKLYHLEEKKKRHAQLSDQEKSIRVGPCWSGLFKKYGAYLSALLIIVCCVTPLIARMLPFTQEAARFMVALVTPSFHVLYAFAIGSFIMLASTGHANKYLSRFLAASYWKPLARLSLCSVLVNVEVINYILQSKTRQQHITNGYLATMSVICILSSYLAATVVCVLFEAPIRSGLNGVFAASAKRMAKKQKQKTS